MNPDKMFEERNILLKKMQNQLESCKGFMVEKVIAETDLEDILSIPFEDLPTRLSGENGNIASIIEARLKGSTREEIENDPNLILPLLWDVEYSVDDYKAIGINDGELQTISTVFQTLGEEDKAKQAYSWVYSD